MEPGVSKSNRNTLKLVLLLILGAGLIGIGVFSARALTNQPTSTEFSVVPARVNFPAPEITLNDLSGNKVTLSDYREKIVLINNWATWCPPCKAEMPTLATYFKDHSDQGFTLLGIEAGDPLKDVAEFVKEYNLQFPVLIDPNNKSLILFHNDSLPSSYVIDHQGNVILAWTGPISREMLEKYVTPLLEQ